MSATALKQNSTLQHITDEISLLIHARTGISVPNSVITSHFRAEGTGMSSLGGNGIGGYNLAGIMQKVNGKYQLRNFSNPGSFISEYANTASNDINGAISRGYISKGSVLNQGQYAAALQYGGSNPYCSSQCGNFYQVSPQGSPLFGFGSTANPNPSGSSVPSPGSQTTKTVAKGTKQAINTGSGLLGGAVSGFESWLSQVAGRVGLVVLFAVLAIVVFANMVRKGVVG